MTEGEVDGNESVSRHSLTPVVQRGSKLACFGRFAPVILLIPPVRCRQEGQEGGTHIAYVPVPGRLPVWYRSLPGPVPVGEVRFRS
jgi:hypothetical protein